MPQPGGGHQRGPVLDLGDGVGQPRPHLREPLLLQRVEPRLEPRPADPDVPGQEACGQPALHQRQRAAPRQACGERGDPGPLVPEVVQTPTGPEEVDGIVQVVEN
ncbi:hypothetical protein AQJ46_35660 [Streptomyces canus]|uniref:Uncharacterized protein n=1 Tax=Streptomyces canus TaxID=58343 RepID=A0A101RT15_9ACTN|nr:hypothetical protein AQJ46_35660 [Streptomyces canus]